MLRAGVVNYLLQALDMLDTWSINYWTLFEVTV